MEKVKSQPKTQLIKQNLKIKQAKKKERKIYIFSVSAFLKIYLLLFNNECLDKYLTFIRITVV